MSGERTSAESKLVTLPDDASERGRRHDQGGSSARRVLQFFCLCRHDSAVYEFVPKRGSKEGGGGGGGGSQEEAVSAKAVRSWSGVQVAGWTPDGRLLYLQTAATPNDIQLVDADQGFHPVCTLNGGSPVRYIGISPLSRFMVVWYRYAQTENPANLVVWNLQTKAVACRYTLRALLTTKWPVLQWSDQETYCCRQATNVIEIFVNCNGDVVGNTPTHRLQLDGIQDYQLSPERKLGEAYIATFVPQDKGSNPGLCSIYDLPKLPDASSGHPCAPVCSKRFFQAQEIEFLWSPDAQTLLILAMMDTDKSGKSYYGSNSLHLMRHDNGYSSLLVSAENGPIQDVRWNPVNGAEFMLLKGPMPPEVVLCDGKKGDVILSFGRSSRNTIRWNRFGKLLAVAGFGNLAGELDLWHRPKKKKIGSTTAACTVVCEFGPDGQHLLAATTSPRLRVDNDVRIYKHTGDLLWKQAFDELYDVYWRPCWSFEDREPSPLPTGQHGVTKAPSETSVYRAPGSTGSFAARLRADRDGSTSFTMTSRPVAAPQPIPGHIPGYAPPLIPKAKGKSKKGKKETAGEATAGGAANDTTNAKRESGRETVSSKVDDVDEWRVPSVAEDDVIRKAIRAVNKKLRRIEALKERPSLTVVEQGVVNNEAELLNKLDELNKQMEQFAIK